MCYKERHALLLECVITFLRCIRMIRGTSESIYTPPMVLSEGFEAPHGCQVMLDTLEVRPRSNVHVDDDDGAADLLEFEVVLHLPSQFMKRAAVDSSAFNKHCALSLLMGLAVHPSVQTVEVGQRIELASVMSNDVGDGGVPLVAFGEDLMASEVDDDARPRDEDLVQACDDPRNAGRDDQSRLGDDDLTQVPGDQHPAGDTGDRPLQAEVLQGLRRSHLAGGDGAEPHEDDEWRR